MRPFEDKENIFEISNSQDSGRVEVLVGEYTKENEIEKIHFKMKFIHNDPRMKNSERIFEITENSLSYIVKMSTQNTPEHQQHLKSLLKKIK
ncbi:FABP family protein [Flavobacterium sp. ZT3R18]|nr:FABP family protein [Flavobacterium sp. ZT3R18]